ncbi:hypothetical protein HW532_05800 [Kaustia mangrovi]|uniref:N-acetyltransferase domain-containing protein n=1 Tax=Kaustia mangrovi TaxID=2593653 RepID=A0A7S8C2M3_9HYPH|nr:GNAT family N-acetyltransferase [Kaustia mangrovi]QPC42259.1 hypothetical protein HW532_05800 [Kaustia mangrovi]
MTAIIDSPARAAARAGGEGEWIERLALRDLHAAAGDDLRARLGLGLHEVGGALVSVVGRDPNIVLNRTHGLGLGTPATPEALAEIVDLYEAAGVERYFVHIHPQAEPAALGTWLAAKGLAPARGWMKFARGRQAPPEVETSLHVARVGPELANAFGRIAGRAFGFSQAGGELVGGLAGQPGWWLYMTFDGDEPVGTGALRIEGDVAWFDYGATRPDYRRRGSQGALLARRIRDALDLGCRHLVTTTGEAVPGDPQHSYRNLERFGFEPAYRRDNFAPHG